MNKNDKEKKSYGEFEHVKLTDDEVRKLSSRFPSLYESYIEKLDLYIEQFGKDKYKSHFATITNWIRRDQEKVVKPNSAGTISRRPSYNLEQIKEDAMNNTKIRY